MSNEDFKAPQENGKTLAENMANMSSTGNRIVTNTDVKVELEVPERTQSYDQFIKQMRDEFFMALADPSLKLGLEEGFTKATSVTASDIYKFKIATMRRIIKEHFEDLFEQILDKMGYDGRLANIQLNFGPEETAAYEVKEIWDAVKNKVITPNEARKLLSKYKKWDINGNIEGGDKPLEIKPAAPFVNPDNKNSKVSIENKEEEK